MRVFARLGQRPDALRQFHHLRGVLQAELGVEPDTTTVQLYEDIRGGHFPARPALAAMGRRSPYSRRDPRQAMLNPS